MPDRALVSTRTRRPDFHYNEAGAPSVVDLAFASESAAGTQSECQIRNHARIHILQCPLGSDIRKWTRPDI